MKQGIIIIIILLILILVILIYTYIIPQFKIKQTKSRKIDKIVYNVQSAIAAIRQTYRVHYHTHGTTKDYDIESALIDAQLGNRIKKEWEFEVIGYPPMKIIATSTYLSPIGEGKQIWYDYENATYGGYGVD